MSNQEDFQTFNMELRKGESVTDVPDWDNEVLEWDSATGVYYVAGKAVSQCQGVAMFKDEVEKNEQ